MRHGYFALNPCHLAMEKQRSGKLNNVYLMAYYKNKKRDISQNAKEKDIYQYLSVLAT